MSTFCYFINNESVQNWNRTHSLGDPEQVLSIPDVLVNATLSHDNSKVEIPRSRIVDIFAHSERARPVYAPCHPIDLEGLQETAV